MIAVRIGYFHDICRKRNIDSRVGELVEILRINFERECRITRSVLRTTTIELWFESEVWETRFRICYPEYIIDQ